MARVKAGKVYRFERNGMDRLFSHASVEEGQLVRVVNLPMAPKCNTMGQCHVENLNGTLLGMVDCSSLVHAKEETPTKL